MKTPKELVRLIRESQIITNPGVDDRILQDSRNEMAKQQQIGNEPGGVLWRTLMKSKKTALVTASMIVIVAFIVFQFIGNPVGPSMTFASVIEPILKAKTAAYDIVVGPDNDNMLVIHDLVMGSRIRRTVAGAKEVAIIDLENWRVLFLNEANMEARYMDLKEIRNIQNYRNGMPSLQNYLEVLKNIILRLKEMPDFTVKELGRKQLDGREVAGFFASHPELNITAWADVNTGLPVCIELNEGQAQLLHLTFKNMEFDLPMEEEIFSMEVPSGYTVREPMTMDFRAREYNFIELLRLFAVKFNYGLFPDDISFDYFYRWRTGPFSNQIQTMSEEEKVALDQKLVGGLLFIRFFPGEGKWTYRGKGVRLGETGTPIFWYRPKGSENYHVIYGDLHVENIAPEKLPQ